MVAEFANAPTTGFGGAGAGGVRRTDGSIGRISVAVGVGVTLFSNSRTATSAGRSGAGSGVSTARGAAVSGSASAGSSISTGAGGRNTALTYRRLCDGTRTTCGPIALDIEITPAAIATCVVTLIAPDTPLATPVLATSSSLRNKEGMTLEISVRARGACRLNWEIT